jgi:hypothetical protein
VPERLAKVDGSIAVPESNMVGPVAAFASACVSEFLRTISAPALNA